MTHRNISTGSARSVGRRRIRKSYLLVDGTTVISRSAAGARAASKGLKIEGLGTAAAAAPDEVARSIDTDKVTVTAEPPAGAQPKAVAKAGTQKAKKKVSRKKRK